MVDRATSAQSSRDRITPVILHVGTDSALLTTRSSVLERTGFPVLRIANLEDIGVMLRDNPRGLMVVCHSLSASQRTEITDKVGRQNGVAGLVLAKDRAASLESSIFATISNHEGPHALVLRAKEMLSAL